MKINSWASFPRWWVRDSLHTFTAGCNAGRNMAALKVYLAVALGSGWESRETTVSLSQLEEATGLSRPMVVKGVHAAIQAGLLNADKSAHTHRYTMACEPNADITQVVPFAKVPRARLAAALPKMPARGGHALDSLKLYIALVTVRQRSAFHAQIGHRKIVEWTGIKPNRVRAAIDVLINHGLVHVVIAEGAKAGHPYNHFQLLGFTRESHDDDANDHSATSDVNAL